MAIRRSRIGSRRRGERAVVSSGGATPRRKAPDRAGRPVADTRVLLLGTAASEPLAKVLGGPGRALTRIDDPERLLAAAAENDIVVLDVAPPPRTLADVCRELRAVTERA